MPVTINSWNSQNPAQVALGGTGASTLTGVLTGNGTSAITASAVTQYALLVGGASNAVGSVADVATGQVLISGGASANPSFSAYPQVSGLGVGASAGSTAGITFDGTNFLNFYSTGTFTPTLYGSSTAGTTTYGYQYGYYTRIGNLAYVNIYMNVTAATGTGNVIIGGLPFTLKNQNAGYPGTLYWGVNSSWAWPSSNTGPIFSGLQGTTTGNIICLSSTGAGAAVQMANGNLTLIITLMHQI